MAEVLEATAECKVSLTCHGDENSLPDLVQGALVMPVCLEGSMKHAAPPCQGCKQRPASSHAQSRQSRTAQQA